MTQTKWPDEWEFNPRQSEPESDVVISLPSESEGESTLVIGFVGEASKISSAAMREGKAKMSTKTKKKPFRITLSRILRRIPDACLQGLEAFKKQYPNGVTVTTAELGKAIEYNRNANYPDRLQFNMIDDLLTEKQREKFWEHHSERS